MSPVRQVVFVNRFYWPDEPATAQLLADLAEALAVRGFAVTVVTSAPLARGVPRHETRNGVVIERLPAFRSSRRSWAVRLREFIGFHWLAFRHLRRLLCAGDIVVAMTDPPLLGVTAAAAAALRGSDLVHWTQDIYPEIATVVTGKRWLLALRPLRNLAWRRSRACIVPGGDLARTVTANGVPPHRAIVAANWAPSGIEPPRPDEVAALRSRWGLDGRFVAAYSGNFGRVHDLQVLLDVADALRSDPGFVLLLIGGGAQCAALVEAARRRHLPNVVFQPFQPRVALAASLGAADVHFVTLRAGAEASVYPSKLYGIARVGRPVIFVGAPDAEIARLVRSAPLGLTAAPGDPAAATAAVQRLRADPELRRRCSQAGLALAAPGFPQAVSIWEEVLARALPRPPAPANPKRP